MHQVYVYVPESHKGAVKEALFEIGIGEFGGYSHCCWETQGTGQFKPLAGSHPAVGTVGSIHHEPEYKLEFLCDCETKLKQVLTALKSSHPYETPAYGVIKLESY